MSVINRMLQDLEQRRAGQDPGALLPGGVRVVAVEEKPRRLGWALLALAVMAALGWGGVRLWYPTVTTEQPRPVAAGLPPEPRPSLRLASVPPAPAKARRSSHALPEPAPKPKQEAVHAVAKTSPEPSGEKAIVAAQTRTESTVKRVSPRQQAEFLYQQALGLLQQGRVTEAQTSLESALAADGGHAAARRLLAGLLLEAKRYGEAEQVLEEGLRLHIEEATSAMALARLRVERGDGRGALELLQQYLPQGENNAAYRAFLATLLQSRGQHRQAIEHYQVALQLTPGNGPWLVGLGISLQADNRPADALDAFNRAQSAGGLSPELRSFVEQRIGQLNAQQP